MNELADSYDVLYERYENLILQRDRLLKEGELYRLNYLREFGDKITESFQLRIDCISLKKSISFCQAKINAGKEIDPISMQEYIDAHMLAYAEQLKDLTAMVKAGKTMKPISLLDAEAIKRIYRKVAKRLHPDICPLTAENPELMEFFQKVLMAYRANDLKAIREAETLINHFLQELGEEPFSGEIENLPEKITDLEAEISNILSTEPYSFKLLLEDDEAMGKKHKELDEEIEYYRNYKSELQAHLFELLAISF